jgi:hypothetical protein
MRLPWIHNSDRTIEKLAEWQHKDLEIFGLPTYSSLLTFNELIP